jgi:RNA polymerase sigma-70 factor (ECF subfamily)
MHPTASKMIDTACGAVFRTTDWGIVQRAGHVTSPDKSLALDHICGWYWKPLYAFARRKGHSPEEAQDLTQGFFAVLLEKNYLSSADRARGRFRTFLLSAFENFLRNDWAYQRALKRGGDVTFVPLNLEVAENNYQQERGSHHPPSTLFERRWAISLLESVLERIRVEFTKAGKSSQFVVLEVFLSGTQHSASYSDAASKLELSETAVRVAVHRLRVRYGKLLRQAVAETLSDPDDVEDELRHLLAVLSG